MESTERLIADRRVGVSAFVRISGRNWLFGQIARMVNDNCTSGGGEMHGEAQTIARLKSMIFLIEEALRIADEGDSAMLGAKLSDCIDCLHTELARIDGLRVDEHARTGGNPVLGILPWTANSSALPL